jgi:MFS family permease
MLDWSAEFLHANAGFDTAIAGLGYSFFSISMALGRYTGDRMIQKLGVPLVFQLGALIAAAGFFVVVSLHWAYLEFLGFSLIGFGAANIVPILFGSSGKIPRVSSSAALTVVTTFGYVGCLIGPALIGFIAKFFSLPLAFMIVAIFLVFIGFIGKKAIQRPQIA